MSISEVNYLVSADKVCDYIPIVSAITNIVALFIKCVVLPFLSQETIQGSHFYTHLQEKSFARCVLLLVPILGNIIIGILDCQSQGETPELPLHSLVELKRDYDRERPSREALKRQRETERGKSIHALRNYVPQPVNPENERLQEQLLQGAGQFLKEIVGENGIVEIMMDYAGHRLSEREKAAIAKVNEDSRSFYYETDEMKGNFSVVEAAMNKDGRLLQFASQEMRENFDIVKIAVEQNGHALQYASQELRDNFDIVKAAVEQRAFEPHMKQCITTSRESAYFHLGHFIKEPLKNNNEVMETLYQRLLTLYAEADLINNAG